ncbi:MAG: chain length determinant protein EpsF [Comamonadaceae bacterium]|nr:chain length determinant protein EpsF [Comamonadaceae bacterium]
MTPTQFFLILRARWWVAVLVFLVTVGSTAVFTLSQPKKYTASAAVVVDVKSPDPVTGMMLTGMMAPGYMATQVDIINSDRVAKTVVSTFGLDRNPNVRAQWQQATEGKGTPLDWLAGTLRRELDVVPSRESNVINIGFTGSDPAFAAAIANAFARAYIDVNLELRVNPAREYAKFFEDQTKSARERLEAARKALSDYQQTNRITAADERLDHETTRLNEISSQLTQIQAQTTDSQSKRDRGANSDTVAEVIQNPVINGLKADIARLEGNLKEIGTNFGQNHPQMLSMRSEIDTLRAQLASETRKITSSIDTTYEVSRQREGQLRAALAAQKDRVLLLNRQRDEIQLLRSELDSAQRQFEMVSARASQTNIESQTNQTNISLLNPATAPIEPSSPQVIFNLLASVFLGTLLGLALVLMLELINRRIRSTEDLVDLPNLPLLGQLSSARRAIKLVGAGARA